MGKYTREELEEALQIVSSVITRCEKAQPKFVEATSQRNIAKLSKDCYYFLAAIDHNALQNRSVKSRNCPRQLTSEHYTTSERLRKIYSEVFPKFSLRNNQIKLANLTAGERFFVTIYITGIKPSGRKPRFFYAYEKVVH